MIGGLEVVVNKKRWWKRPICWVFGHKDMAWDADLHSNMEVACRRCGRLKCFPEKSKKHETLKFL